VQLEGRWLSPFTDQRFAVVNWQGPNDMGAIALNLGVAVELSEFLEVMTGGADDVAANAPTAPADAPPAEVTP
jgi:hypothetical protein